MLPGLLVTVPLPVPNLATVKVYFGINRVNVAVTNWSELIGMVHVPVPAQEGSLQPSKLDPGNGVAVSVTIVPSLNPAVQVDPQLMLAGLLITVPLPSPDLDTVRVLYP
jgi:hypothetical protein